MNEHELERAETIDTGFFIDPSGATRQPGRIARTPDGRLCVVLLERHANVAGGIGPVAEQDGTLWQFSGEKDQYALFGVRGGPVGESINRCDFRDGYEVFIRQRFDVDAVFRVSGGPQPQPMAMGMGFDALGIVLDVPGLWVGLELPSSHEYPPQRPRRKRHSKCDGRVGEISIDYEGFGDMFGDTWHHSDVVNILCFKPGSLDVMYGIGRVVHDFVNLTFGPTVPAKFVLYTTGGHADRHKWRRFELISQVHRLREREPSRHWAPMLSLTDVGGLTALDNLIQWCGANDLNGTIFHRVAQQWDKWEDAFPEHWRTLTMLFGGNDTEHCRFAKLVDSVGKGVAKAVKPSDIGFKEWQQAIANYRNEVVAHPAVTDPLDYRVLREGPAFTHHMEFLLKAYVLKHGLRIELSTEVIDRLKQFVNDWNKWDWRDKIKSHSIY